MAATQRRHYTSAIERLQALPAVFTGRDLTRLFAWRSGTASGYLAAWKRRGVVQSLGGRSDVHFNLIAQRHPDIELGLRKAYPRAVRVGLRSLTEAGWTTQIDRSIEIAVPSDTKVFAIDGVRVTLRPEGWFAAVSRGIQNPSVPMLHRLRPAWALADALRRAQDRRVRDAWLPDPGDLDWERIGDDRRARRDWGSACMALRVEGIDLLEGSYARAYDTWRARPEPGADAAGRSGEALAPASHRSR